MIADLKPYAEYKESGLPWLGRVPGHWELRRLKQIARLTYGDALPRTGHTEGTVPVFGSNGRVGWHSNSNTTAPCIVVGRKGSFGKINFCNEPAFVIDTAFFIDHRISKTDMRWLYYTLGWIRLDGVSKDSAIPGLDREDAYQQVAALPPPAEQGAIGRFLDWANGRLERAIRAKRKVIALLNEQKQAIIHRAVTRGLDPSVPFKPSGIPWLGDIPQHWEVRRLGHAIDLQTGFPFASTGFVQSESDTRLLRGINVTPSGLRWDSVVRWQRKQGDGLDEFALEIGDITLGMDRPIVGAGVRAATVQENDIPSLLLQRVARLRPKDKLDANFLLLLLRGRLFRDYIAPIFTGISVPHLSPEQIKGFKVPLPTLAEQRCIVSHLAAETRGLDNAATHLEREIDLLREYRTRLVADVVTGKLDVREAAARLPDEAPLATDYGTDPSLDSEAADEESVA